MNPNSTPITSKSVPSAGDVEHNVFNHDLGNALNRVESAMPAPPPAPVRTSEQENLANYGAMSYEERMAVIEKLIVDGISDDNFVTLCEDVYGCWQRIGFGR
jgi:hypothetical protein